MEPKVLLFFSRLFFPLPLLFCTCTETKTDSCKEKLRAATDEIGHTPSCIFSPSSQNGLPSQSKRKECKTPKKRVFHRGDSSDEIQREQRSFYVWTRPRDRISWTKTFRNFVCHFAKWPLHRFWVPWHLCFSLFLGFYFYFVSFSECDIISNFHFIWKSIFHSPHRKVTFPSTRKLGTESSLAVNSGSFTLVFAERTVYGHHDIWTFFFSPAFLGSFMACRQ